LIEEVFIYAHTYGLRSECEEESSVHMASGLVINADDWGFDIATTAASYECIRKERVSSVSAMMWMKDSARAAELALCEGIDAGLHLNLTTEPYEMSSFEKMRSDFQKVASFLRINKFSSLFFNPILIASFKRIVEAQIEEYERLYKNPVGRVDGHHHMHLCSNVLLQNLLPPGVVVRRSFTFSRGEKSALNYKYRSLVDQYLVRRWKIVDKFYALPPMDSLRVEKIINEARNCMVEVETHPVIAGEGSYLLGDQFGRLLDISGVRVESHCRDER